MRKRFLFFDYFEIGDTIKTHLKKSILKEKRVWDIFNKSNMFKFLFQMVQVEIFKVK